MFVVSGGRRPRAGRAKHRRADLPSPAPKKPLLKHLPRHSPARLLATTTTARPYTSHSHTLAPNRLIRRHPPRILSPPQSPSGCAPQSPDKPGPAKAVALPPPAAHPTSHSPVPQYVALSHSTTQATRSKTHEAPRPTSFKAKPGAVLAGSPDQFGNDEFFATKLAPGDRLRHCLQRDRSVRPVRLPSPLS